ncbi:ATP-dependent protease [Sulfuriferula sp. AH1]|uniref:Lon protease family protein n=1 Tax=Sulfuriferula sp. AH1 TaxID=1985873 RepID=UPI000B3B2813|nr:ATP-binding protein [Sulfuriferula sp. AH1]ARU30508.1 ATP-dependent protease [Sulfuriferula sp. AH1]
MPLAKLLPSQLRLTLDPAFLGFANTVELVTEALPWIGQERAEKAAHFGLSLDQPGYNLFVLGEVGSGRSSLLEAAMRAAAAKRSPPPDLCYLHHFDVPEKPIALRLPAGQGRVLRDMMAELVKVLQAEIPRRLAGPEFKAESERVQKSFKDEEAVAYAELSAFAAARRFTLHREDERMIFTLLNAEGRPVTEAEMLALPAERKAGIDRDEQALRVEIARFLDKVRPKERAGKEALGQFKRHLIKPLLEHELQQIRAAMKQQIMDAGKLGRYLDALAQDVLDQLELYGSEDVAVQIELAEAMAAYRVNLVVDNSELSGAPALVEDNPLFRSLFGSIEYQVENDVLMTDFSRIRAGSLLRAHGGFLLLHLRDLFGDPLVWEKLRRFLRSGRLQIEEPGTLYSPNPAVSLEPEAVDVAVKIILIGTREHYYELQEADPEFGRYFRIKVDFAESFKAGTNTHRDSAIFIAHVCQRLGLSHFTADAVARLLEEMHREADDQLRLYAVFAYLEQLVTESAALAQGDIVQRADVEAALAAKTWRHDYPDQRLHESIAEGELLIAVQGERVGHINGLTQIDLGDHRFGLPVVVSARTFPGEDGVLNIEREVEMSGPIHDKGVFILQTYFASLFAHLGPLSVDGALVFEQEYHGVEGDSASCAELYALLSSLSGLPVRQGIAVTGALNQFGEVLPIGGINEKIEGFFRVCREAGLDGSQGVILPARNRSHLMLGQEVIEAVAQGQFRIHVIDHVLDGLELLMDCPSGELDETGIYTKNSVLGRAQKTLMRYHRICNPEDHLKTESKQRHGVH